MTVSSQPQRASATGRCAEFSAFGLNGVADVIEKFGGKGAAADPGGVRFDNADNPIDHFGTDASAATGIAGNGVGRGHKRVGAVIDVQVRALRPFEKNLTAGSYGVVQFNRDIGHVRCQPLGIGSVLVDDRIRVKRFRLEVVGQIKVFFIQDGFDPFGKNIGVEQFHEPDAPPCGLVFITGANATTGGADFFVAFHLFAGMVDLFVVGHDEMRLFADAQFVRSRIDTLLRQIVESLRSILPDRPPARCRSCRFFAAGCLTAPGG